MNREDIIRMARECGIPEYENNESQANNIIRFAAIVASAEREKIAEYIDRNLMSCREYADAIRARGDKK
jgi:hypothetical protein